MNNLKYIVLYIIGALIVIGGLIMFIVSILSTVSTIDKDSTRFVAPGEIEIAIDKPGKYIIYYEYQSTLDGKLYSTGNADVSGLGLRVIDTKTNENIDLSATAMTATYTVNGRSGTSMFEFEIDEPKDINVMSTYVDSDGPNVVLNVSSDITGSVFKGMGIILGYFFGGGLIGFTIIIVTIIMHLKARKKYKALQNIS